MAMKGTLHIANSPVSWGVLEFEGLQRNRISYQQMLDELAEAGYAGTELGDWGYMPTKAEDLQAEMVQRGLTLLGAFVPVALKDRAAHAPGEAHALKVAGLLAEVTAFSDSDHEPLLVLADDNGTDPVRTQNAGRVKPGMALSDQEWQIFAHGTQRIASAVKNETGLRTVFHHHCAGYVETPGELARLLEMTDPQVLGLVFDTGHFMYGSGTNDPQVVLDGLDRFADRIWYLHLKDCHPEIATRARTEGWDYFEAVGNGLFCELGQGAVDFPAVVAWLAEAGYQGWAAVERDVFPGMGTPGESARRDRDYLRSIGV